MPMGMTPGQLQDARARGRTNFRPGAAGSLTSTAWNPYLEQQKYLARQGQTGAQAAPSVNDGIGTLDPVGARKRAFSLLEGRSDDIMNDPQYAAAMQAYQDVLTSGGPMNEQVQNAMAGQLADQGARAQQIQQQQMARQLAASGGSINDPSYQAAQRGMTTQRQLSNQGNRRDIMMQAAMDNFRAQQAAAGNLASVRGQQYGMSNPLLTQAANEYMNTVDQSRTSGGTPVMPASYARPVTNVPAQQQNTSGGRRPGTSVSMPPLTARKTKVAGPQPKPQVGGWSTPQSELMNMAPPGQRMPGYTPEVGSKPMPGQSVPMRGLY